METIQYCGNFLYTVVYDENHNEIGDGYIRTDKNNQELFIMLHCNNLYTFAHLCNREEFKCNKIACNHTFNGIVPLMIIESYLSIKKLSLNLLNESFVSIKISSFLDLEIDSLRKNAYISYDSKFGIYDFRNTILHCGICNERFEIHNNRDKKIAQKKLRF